jgi:hypothetical protein
MPKRKHAKPAATHVGIFFLVDQKLLIDPTPISKEEICGDFSIHERSYDASSEILNQTRVVPQDSEYDDCPI